MKKPINTSFYRVYPQGSLNFEEIVADNFAGGGGASTGIELALGRPVDIAVNHDIDAIRMHEVNHPGTRHFCESVWDVNPVEITGGRPVGLAWFSPDCKHFSKARGGTPVSKLIRGLAWVAVKWAATAKPRVMIIENVEEFVTWGPVVKDASGDLYPCPKRKSQTFQSFKNALARLGYIVEHRELRACDYGTPTIRKRFFLVARCDGQPIVWPKPTHGPGLLPYKVAADIIDWSLPCPSIFERKKPLADATLRRIAEGIRKFVVEAAEPFIVPIAHYNGRDTVHDIRQPLRTITAHPKGGSFALCTPFVAPLTHRGKGRINSLTEPLPTVTAAHRGEQALIVPTLVQTGYGERKGQAPRVPGLDKPLGTVVATQKHALVAAFLAKHYTGVVGADMRRPVPTITSIDHNALVAANMVKLRGTSVAASVAEPLHTISAGGTHYAEVRAFLIKYYGNEQGGIGLEEPLHTIPCHDRFGLVMVHGEPYQIVDIGMRMLSPRELFRAQGFPDDYVIEHDGHGKAFTKTAQVARCGNSVCPPLAEALVRANMGQQQAAEAAA